MPWASNPARVAIYAELGAEHFADLTDRDLAANGLQYRLHQVFVPTTGFGNPRQGFAHRDRVAFAFDLAHALHLAFLDSRIDLERLDGNFLGYRVLIDADDRLDALRAPLAALLEVHLRAVTEDVRGRPGGPAHRQADRTVAERREGNRQTAAQHGQGSRVFMSMNDMSDLTGQMPRAALFYVKVNDPDQENAVKAEIEQLLKGYTINYAKDFATLLSSSNIPGLGAFIDAMIMVAMCVGVLVIFLSMYTAITERTREIGILRSLGASKAFIVGLIFRETTVLCSLGVIVGTIGTLLIQRILREALPTLIILIPTEWIFYAAAFAILSGVIGAFYPSLKAASQDPVEALAYE